MKKIIVTGATSMIGVALIEECIKENVFVTAIVRKNSNRISRLPQSKLVHVVELDMDELASFDQFSESYDCFYHLAWGWTSKDVRDNPECQLNNIIYSMDAVKLAYRCGCKKFIGAGSQAEYGICSETITPDIAVQPYSSYGICKFATGKLVSKLCEQHGMISIWGRIFSVYGDNDNDGTMIRYAFEQYHKNEEAHFSAGTQMWNYLHASDAGRMLYLMGEKCNNSKVYNIAHNISQPLKDYIEEIGQVLGDGFKCTFEKKQNGNAMVQLNPDVSETVKDLNYYPKISFSEGIRMLKEKQFGL